MRIIRLNRIDPMQDSPKVGFNVKKTYLCNACTFIMKTMSWIYFERVISSGESFSSLRKEEDDAKTQFDSSVLTEFTTDRMTFDGVTYRRVD